MYDSEWFPAVEDIKVGILIIIYSILSNLKILFSFDHLEFSQNPHSIHKNTIDII